MISASATTATLEKRRPKAFSAVDLSPAVGIVSSEVRAPDPPFPPPRSDAWAPAERLAELRKLDNRLAQLPNLASADLREEWRRFFRVEPPRLSRDIIMRALAYRLQEIVHGGLSRVLQRRLAALANEFESDGRVAALPPPRIKPGARLVREWQGSTYTVNVVESGFTFEGKMYRSLTSIAFEITGAHWSGPRFFGLTKTIASTTPTNAPNAENKLGENPNE